MNDIKHFKKITRLKFKNLKLALDLQAKEYERRLTDLNHKEEKYNAQLNNIQQSYLTKSEFDKDHALLIVKVEYMQKIIWIIVGIGLLLEVGLKFIKY